MTTARKHFVIVAIFISVSAAARGEEKPGGFVVVAPEAFHAALGAYVEHKSAQRATTLVSLEDVLKNSAGVDDAEKLKRFLFDAWKERGVRYALLVGDADVMPVRYMALDRYTPEAFNYSFYPSDLYYSDLAKPDGRFDDWNAATEGFHAGYFGEVRGESNKGDAINFDGVDYLPDIAVGRWPVSTEAEARTVAEKTVAYEKGLQTGQKEGMRRAAMVSVGGWVDSRYRMDSMASGLEGAWEITRRYYADGRRDDKTPPPNSEQVVGLLNEGVGLMLHAGHGQDDLWEQCFSVGDLSRVKNGDRLPVIISAGCSTARFATLPPYEPYVDVEGKEHRGTYHGEKFTAPPPPPAVYQRGRFNLTGLGEQLLRRGPDGAVAYIGCNTGSQPCGLTLLDGFTRAFGEERGATLGDAWSGAVKYYHERERLATLRPTNSWYPPSVYFQGMKFMLFGDPTLLVPSQK